MGNIKLITKETLQSWGACASGYKAFCRLLPDGATLKNASEALIREGNSDYANWLWVKAKADDEYTSQTIVTAGNRGTATAGDMGTATAGDRGTATAGDRGTATAGDRGTATAGDWGTATAGFMGTATAGDWGCIVIQNHNEPYQMICNAVDGDKIKPNTPYKLDDYENFIEVTQCQNYPQKQSAH